MVRRLMTPFLGGLLCALTAWGGALALQVSDPASNPEARDKHAVLIVQTTACHAPEKTSMTATVEGVVDGKRESHPLKMVALSTPGTFAVTRDWPSSGKWAVKVVARNPEYKNYATGVVAAFNADAVDWSSVQRYSHEPTDAEVASALHVNVNEDRASLK